MTFPDGWNAKPRLGGQASRLMTAKWRAQCGLDSGRASAMVLLSGERQF